MELTRAGGPGRRTWGDPVLTGQVVLAPHGLPTTAAVWADLAGRLDIPLASPTHPAAAAAGKRMRLP